MFKTRDRREGRRQVRRRIRGRISGTAQRPRLAVYRSLKHIYAQAVDDVEGRTVAAASSVDAEVRAAGSYGGNVAAAKAVGEKIAERLLAAGCQQVVFDRGGYIYHGRVKALAEAARGKGLQF
jgi:large subunit ribosomal protein L18